MQNLFELNPDEELLSIVFIHAVIPYVPVI